MAELVAFWALFSEAFMGEEDCEQKLKFCYLKPGWVERESILGLGVFGGRFAEQCSRDSRL